MYAGYDSYAEMERESDGTSSQIFTGNRCRFPVNRAALDVIVEKKKEEDKSLYVSDEDGNFHKKEPIEFISDLFESVTVAFPFSKEIFVSLWSSSDSSMLCTAVRIPFRHSPSNCV